MREFISQEVQNVTVSFQTDGSPYPLATASVSGPTSDPTCWYLNRVLVHEGQRRQGHGRRVLQRLRDVCLERQNTHPDWPQVKSILVEPGGYGSKPEVLLKFYEACGFQLSEDKSCLTLVLDERKKR